LSLCRGSELGAATSDVKEGLENSKSDIATLDAGIKNLDTQDAEATEQRKEEHSDYQTLLAGNGQAKGLENSKTDIANLDAGIKNLDMQGAEATEQRMEDNSDCQTLMAGSLCDQESVSAGSDAATSGVVLKWADLDCSEDEFEAVIPVTEVAAVSERVLKAHPSNCSTCSTAASDGELTLTLEEVMSEINAFKITEHKELDRNKLQCLFEAAIEQQQAAIQRLREQLQPGPL
jgi:DNA-binding NarL/FixJ family response regulator